MSSLQEAVIKIMELAEEIYPNGIDNSGKIMAEVAHFGFCCAIDSDVRKEAEEFCMNNMEKENEKELPYSG